ncbi:energy-coupling factor transport system ATP-binding protein [Gracilibacillus ureilyticus]|uniref:Energy-coupling factor transport system ATP-binding protein n=1 Tax=Gracilibacillus ureilyticus TaxID=531814 RepID=A0A1H9VFU8_9BACI|nr:energy-coupling factor transporter ATPase [Gracilibacillus ureilyticus]SES20522.1 energy-coupling factor transport system ATP-binding protein [Gracilibacillus ureilyticus]
MTIIEFRDVYFRYNEEQNWVLRNISFSVNAGDSIAIIGHNGSGKSTVAKLINGLLVPQAGDILIDGERVTEQNIWEVRQKAGMVFQNPENQFVGTTVRDDIAFGLENRGIPREEMIKRIERSLNEVGMQDFALHEAHYLSGGQKQRVAIASVMAIQPEVLILDEATSMLDPVGRNEIIKTIQHLKDERNITFLTITHDLSEVTLADRTLVLKEGKLVTDTTPRELFAQVNDWESLGLTEPFTTKIANELEKYGYKFSSHPLNHEELMNELWTYNLKK